MTIDDYKSTSIAIGLVVSARELVEKARDMTECNFGSVFSEDFSKAWGALNGLVCAINDELDCTPIEEESEE